MYFECLKLDTKIFFQKSSACTWNMSISVHVWNLAHNRRIRKPLQCVSFPASKRCSRVGRLKRYVDAEGNDGGGVLVPLDYMDGQWNGTEEQKGAAICLLTDQVAQSKSLQLSNLRHHSC